MLEQLRKRRAGDGGFTLIELLLVIVILGILAAVVVISVSGITGRGKTAACQATLTSVTTANEAYYAQTGGYPTDVATLVPNYLKVGGGASVAGNLVSGNGWSFTFTPATGASTPACPVG
jgi:general secretion pathway protein G